MNLPIVADPFSVTSEQSGLVCWHFVHRLDQYITRNSSNYNTSMTSDAWLTFFFQCYNPKMGLDCFSTSGGRRRFTTIEVIKFSFDVFDGRLGSPNRGRIRLAL